MKMTHLSSSIMLQLAVICFCLMVGSFSSPLFKYYPDAKVYTNSGAGSAIKISSDDQYVAVGFSNGTFKVYSTDGYLQCTGYGHYSSIIDIESIGYSGWISLDSSGKAIRWSTYCSLQYTWNFNSTVIDMSVTYSAGSYYAAFNLGNTILEYYATTTSNYTTRTYLAQNNTSFTQIQYGNGYYQLFAATNNSYLQSYYCSNGAYGSQLYIYYPGKKFTKPSSGQMAVINSYYVYKFSSTSIYSNFVYSGSANVVTSSYKDYSTQYITADTTYSNYIYVYSEYGYFQQSLSYMSYTVKAIDASDRHLAAIDSYGYLSINSYQTNDWYPTDFPMWVIWMIIGIVALFVVLIVSVVRRRKKRQALLMANNYNRFDDQVAPNAPYFAGNQGYNTNPTIVHHQGWNANQNQPHPINQQPQNPYQANQPTTWS